ncbi:MAG: hypothetical protein QOC58_2346 [Mycobacterium sp.]|nr:hypothetical protein [Mycobacterium sp.]
MFITNARDAEPFVAADLSEIRPLVDRSNTAIASVSLAHAVVAPNAETVWHRLDGTDEVYFILCGRGMVSVGEESRKVGPGDAVWIPAGVPGPAYRAERDERVDAMLAEVRS